jgi:hypothetical protein
VTRIHHIFDVVPSLLSREAPGGDGGLRQWPSAALLTADPFIPAQHTTTCTMQPPGKTAAASSVSVRTHTDSRGTPRPTGDTHTHTHTSSNAARAGIVLEHGLNPPTPRTPTPSLFLPSGLAAEHVLSRTLVQRMPGSPAPPVSRNGACSSFQPACPSPAGVATGTWAGD